MRSFFLKKENRPLDLALVMCPGWGAVQPPVGISYLKSFLQQNNISVKCFDLSMELYKVFPEKKYWDLNCPDHFTTPHLFKKDVLPFMGPFIDIWAEQILRYNPKIVGFSLFMSSINASLLLARHLKKIRPDLIILGGGAEVTRIKRIMVDGIRELAFINREIFSAFDILIDGEGEIGLLEIFLLFRQDRDFQNIDGAVYIKGDKVIANNTRKIIKDLDMLRPPDFSDFKLGDYTRGALPIVTSRGCVNHCTFCADSPLWKSYRQRSAEKVVEEIRFLIKEYRRNQFEITDSTFNGDIRRLDKFCDLVIESGLEIKWSAKVTLRKEMTYGLLQKMREAGSCGLAYGIESGSPRILKDMRKNIDLREAKGIISDTHKARIQANCFFIIGYPMETEEDFQMTLDFIEENADFIHRFDQVTGCHIEEDSYLGLNPDKYGIVFKEDGWHSKDSTPQIRRKRLDRFRKLARGLHKHYQCEVQA